MSGQTGTAMESVDTRNGSLRRAKEGVKNGIPNSCRSPNGFENNSPKRVIRKAGSCNSLNFTIGSNAQGYESKAGITRLKTKSKENGVADRANHGANGRATTEPNSDSQFRDRTPSFTIRQSVPARLQTHFAVYKFVPRHKDELAMNVGDAIHVEKAQDDLWYEGTNLISGNQGIFPSRYVSDILSNTGSSFEFSDNGVQFFLRFLGSVEVFKFKGNTVLCQAVAKILNVRKNNKYSEIPPCSLEVDHIGIRLVDHAQENERRQPKSFVGRLFNNEPKVSQAKYFFKLKDVTFCGCYPNSQRYFGFVTKHPTEHRFACHTFMSEYSTEPVAKAIGKAFKRFYKDYMDQSSSC